MSSKPRPHVKPLRTLKDQMEVSANRYIQQVGEIIGHIFSDKHPVNQVEVDRKLLQVFTATSTVVNEYMADIKAKPLKDYNSFLRELKPFKDGKVDTKNLMFCHLAKLFNIIESIPDSVQRSRKFESTAGKWPDTSHDGFSPPSRENITLNKNKIKDDLSAFTKFIKTLHTTENALYQRGKKLVKAPAVKIDQNTGLTIFREEIKLPSIKTLEGLLNEKQKFFLALARIEKGFEVLQNTKKIPYPDEKVQEVKDWTKFIRTEYQVYLASNFKRYHKLRELHDIQPSVRR